MGGIRQEVRERKLVLKDLRGLFSEQYKGSDQALKLIDRLLRRKQALPTIEDLGKIVDAQSRVEKAFNQITHQLERADRIFETM